MGPISGPSFLSIQAEGPKPICLVKASREPCQGYWNPGPSKLQIINNENNHLAPVKFLGLRSAPPHTGSPGPFGPGTPEESEKSPERVPWGRAPKVPKECAPESQKSPKRVRKSDFRLFLDSFETPGRTLSALLGPCPRVLLPDSFRTLPGFRARRGRGDPVWGGADRNSWQII